ncbi:MAG: 50S ribosomal protein L29 [Candidatus Micrarchaeota archaeon]
MAIYRMKDLRTMANDELDEKSQQLETQLSRERGSVASGAKAENPGKIREIRRTIARIHTLKNERSGVKSK